MEHMLVFAVQKKACADSRLIEGHDRRGRIQFCQEQN